MYSARTGAGGQCLAKLLEHRAGHPGGAVLRHPGRDSRQFKLDSVKDIVIDGKSSSGGNLVSVNDSTGISNTIGFACGAGVEVTGSGAQAVVENNLIDKFGYFA